MKHSLALLFIALSTASAAIAQADTMVYVHGWHPDGRDFSSENGGWNSRMWREAYSDRVVVGWNTGEDWRRSGVNNTIQVLNTNCARNNGQSCTIICHSTGCPITGAALDWAGSADDGTPRWNITRVMALGSAEGGTEMASAGHMANVYWDLVDTAWNPEISEAPSGVVTGSVAYLSVGTVRGAYDHHDTKGVPFFHVAGYDGGWGSFLMPGQDDGVVPFHSACGYVKAFAATQCSSDWEWVRKTKWGVPYYVMREVAQWTNHKRVEFCDRDGCDKRHMQLQDTQFQELATNPNP